MRLENAQLQARKVHCAALCCAVVCCAVQCCAVHDLEDMRLSKARLPARYYANFHAML